MNVQEPANYRHRHKAVKTFKIYDHISVVSVNCIRSCEIQLTKTFICLILLKWCGTLDQVNESTE